jgi:hypothetical protein
MTVANNENQRREEAQAAMESEAHRAARAKKAQEVTHRRHEAQMAMEDEKHRHEREAEEKAERERLTIQQRAEQEAKRQAEVQRLQAERALADKERQAAEQARVRGEQTDRITSSEKLIDQLKEAGNVILSPLRTFKTDMAKAVQEHGLSMAKIAIAEQRRQKEVIPAADKPHSSHWFLIFLFILILIGGGIAAGWYWLKWDIARFVPAGWLPITSTTTPSTIPAAPVATPIFSTEQSQAISLDTNPSSTELVRQITAAINNAATPNSFTNIYFHRGGEVLGFSALRQALALTWPDHFARILNEQFMLGNFSLANGDHRFLILKPKFFEQAFNGMLNWEGTMPESLVPLLGAATPRAAREASFTDRIFRNKDVRLLKNTAGETILLYSFLDPDTIVITKDEETFVELFKRFVAGA